MEYSNSSLGFRITVKGTEKGKEAQDIYIDGLKQQLNNRRPIRSGSISSLGYKETRPRRRMELYKKWL